MGRESRTLAGERRVPKLCGADVELGNFIVGVDRPDGTGYEASRALLAAIDAPHPRGTDGAGGWTPQDWGRKFLATNGGCFYVDLDHLECCLPEVLSGYDHVAAWHAMLRIARRALDEVNAALPEGRSIHVLVNNSDGKGHAYGSHLDFLVTRHAWDDIFRRKLHHLLVLAAFQVSSIVFTGQGKVGAENDTPDTAFQLSQRADFFETVVAPQTTFCRPIVNSRDEPLCGMLQDSAAATDLARLHCIFFDNTLCHGSSLLKVGTMQLLLAMLEAGWASARLIVDDPVAAVVEWSHDPSLAARARMASRQKLTAIEIQLLFLEDARRFAARRGFDGVVPRAGEILALWEDTLEKLRAGDLDALARRIDWVLKLRILERAMAELPGLTWTGPAMKHLDHAYASLDEATGLYWAYERAGAVDRVVDDEAIRRFEREPPEDTRAWGRAMLLRLASREHLEDVDWDRIRFRERGSGYWPVLRTLHLDDPLGFTRAAIGEAVQEAASLSDVLWALARNPPNAAPHEKGELR